MCVETKIKLYRVVETVNILKDTIIIYFMEGREGPVIPYKIGIKDYDKLNKDDSEWAEEALNQCFTHKEAVALKEYLLQTCADIVDLIEVSFPNSLNFHGLPLRKGDIIRALPSEKSQLPFDVGYYCSLQKNLMITEYQGKNENSGL